MRKAESLWDYTDDLKSINSQWNRWKEISMTTKDELDKSSAISYMNYWSGAMDDLVESNPEYRNK